MSLKLPHGHRTEQFHNCLDYSKRLAPEADCSFDQDKFQELCEELSLDEEIVAQIEGWVDEQVRLGMREFLHAFTNKMSHSLHGFCVLRALGYHAHIEDKKGRPITSLRAIAKHFKCSHQYVDKLTKDLEERLGISVPNLQIEKKTYSMNVVPPKGWVTVGQVLKTNKISRTKLWALIEELDIEYREHDRNSKIIRIEHANMLIKEYASGRHS